MAFTSESSSGVTEHGADGPARRSSLGEPDVVDGTTAKFIRRGLSRAATGWPGCQDEAPARGAACGFWTRAWGQRELAEE